jgi:hypothetical protein
MDAVPRWIVVWLVVSTPVTLWDASFLLARPASFPDGDLGFLWSIAYTTYLEVDHSYADLSLGFPKAVAVMSCVEAVIVGAGLAADGKGRHALAHLLLTVVTSLTAAKTATFLMVEGLGGFSHTGHNAAGAFWSLWAIPNGIWLVVPTLAAVTLGRRLLADR